jgi:hypothetical protein
LGGKASYETAYSDSGDEGFELLAFSPSVPISGVTRQICQTQYYESNSLRDPRGTQWRMMSQDSSLGISTTITFANLPDSTIPQDIDTGNV